MIKKVWLAVLDDAQNNWAFTVTTLSWIINTITSVILVGSYKYTR